MKSVQNGKHILSRYLTGIFGFEITLARLGSEAIFLNEVHMYYTYIIHIMYQYLHDLLQLLLRKTLF